MTLKFFEKLDFLMNITNTSNSALALNINLDPSHISRLRRGERNALKNEACIDAISSYFARHCEHDYQQKALSEALKLEEFPSDESRLAKHISHWLSVDGKSGANKEEIFSPDFTKIRNRQAVQVSAGSEKLVSEPLKNDTEFFYGIDGKRRVALEFLTDILTKGKPQTLLLFSDEATDWMAEDPEFAMNWGFLMSQFLSEGGKIKIIHTVSRDLDEMLRAISQWMPLYMTGSIEPYYYPKKRDGVFKRTLFIAPNISAVVSTSVGNTLNQAANVLFRDKKAVASFEKEFREYLSLCKPLMRIFAEKDEEAYFDTLLDFEKGQSSSIIKSESLSLLTMPSSVASAIVSRNAYTNRNFYDFQSKRIELFKKNISSNSFTEIISLCDVETVIKGGVKVSLSDMMSGDTVYYTPEEYINHLENLVCLLDTYENFHVKFIGMEREENYVVYVKEDCGALVAKITAPPVILAIGENNMKAALWDYLISIIDSESSGFRGRDENYKTLTEYIGRLKERSALASEATFV